MGLIRHTKPGNELTELCHGGLIPGGHCGLSATSNKYLDRLEGEMESGKLLAVKLWTSSDDEVHFRLQVQLSNMVDEGGGPLERWDRWTNLTGDRNPRCGKNSGFDS